MTASQSIHITPREKEVLQLICDGKTAGEIGIVLDRSPHTINSHKLALMRKLDIYKDTALVAFAFRNGLVT
ncbi:LuxR family transcriptional regulator protein [Rhizobium sp. TAL182]|uniref:response regulator transcription factor n=1 Tax=Rhizobium sp. TAL182 TaxID=2020313 RepID=UPI000A20F841|nr:LuxR C-terminal-related transcriptional regulator [Rhizobium sp. TAL182]ARO24767.1 LuxR family transcriptional regulator protein [Rhizobium sp. TAL182]